MFMKKRVVYAWIITIVAISGISFAQNYDIEPNDTDHDRNTLEPSGYLEDGSTIYGIDAVESRNESPITEIKKLKKQYFRELKRRESLEDENTRLERRIEELEMILTKRDESIDDVKRKLVEAEFRYMEMEQKITNLKLAILRKKLVRESQYPPYYEVKKNDSLWRIAGSEKIYDNHYKWIEIFYANQDKIADSDYIYPGMILRIPRPELEYEDWTIDGLNLDKLKENLHGIHADDSVPSETIENVIDDFTDDIVPASPATSNKDQ